MTRRASLDDKLQQLWLSGHTADEAFRITHYGMSPRQQDAGLGVTHVAQMFGIWERQARDSMTRDVMVAHLIIIRDQVPR